MSANVVYQQLGQLIVSFQNVENALTDILVEMVNADGEYIRILINELEYSQRVKATDVVFARFLDLREPDSTAKKQFHELMIECLKLGELRNDIVHSTYTHFINLDSALALRRENSKLTSSKGMRKVEEEDLSEASFTPLFERLYTVQKRIEDFRLKLIDWNHPT